MSGANPYADFLEDEAPPAPRSLGAAAAVADANPYADFVPPPAAKPRPPARMADRAQALESGVWRGGAYLAGMIPDVPANVWNLGKAAAGATYGAMTEAPGAQAALRTSGASGVPLYHYRDASGQETYSKASPPASATPYTGQPRVSIPASLEVNAGPSPVGARLAEALDRYHELTPTTMDRPDDLASRYLSAVGGILPGAVVGGGGTIGGTLTAALGATPSVLAGQTIAEAHPFQSDWANTLASAGTQLGTAAAVPALAKTLLRGPSGGQMQANADAFRQAGAEPSVGQASGARRTQFLESALAKIPGGAGVFQKFAGKQAADLGEGAQNTVAGLSSNVSPEAAGEAITRGITGPGGAAERFRQQSRALFSAVDQHVPGRQRVPVTNTLAALDELTAPISGAQNISATLTNPKIAQIREAVLSDLSTPAPPAPSSAAFHGTWPWNKDRVLPTPEPSTLPYTALSRVRSQVGNMIGGNELISGIPRAQLKQLYGALSQDMEGAAAAAGPQASKAWSDAQSFYRSGIERMDQLSSLIDKQGGPEAVFRSALAGTNYGASRLRTVLDSVGLDQRKTVAATVLDRMGHATASNQNAEGSVYSPQTFLTNWNKMAPEAKDALFGSQGSALRDRLENVAGVAENIKSGSKVFANPSGTAGAENQTEVFKHGISLAAGALLGHGGGSAGSIAGAGAAVVGVPSAAYMLSKALTNPSTVNWAARPAIGSSSQAASLSAAPGNLSQTERDRQRLMNALEHLKTPH